MEKARTIRIDAELPKELWAELVSTSVFLYNRNQSTKPYEKFWERAPKLEHIRPIGSELLYSIHHFEKIGKLDPGCKRGILIGFDEEMRSYRIWDPESRLIKKKKKTHFVSGGRLPKSGLLRANRQGMKEINEKDRAKNVRLMRWEG